MSGMPLVWKWELSGGMGRQQAPETRSGAPLRCGAAGILARPGPGHDEIQAHPLTPRPASIVGGVMVTTL